MGYVTHRTEEGISSVVSRHTSLSSTRRLQLLLLSYQPPQKRDRRKEKRRERPSTGKEKPCICMETRNAEIRMAGWFGR